MHELSDAHTHTYTHTLTHTHIQHTHSGLKPPVLLFMQSKDRAKDLYRELVYDGINVDVIHAERTQQQREDIIRYDIYPHVHVCVSTVPLLILVYLC